MSDLIRIDFACNDPDNGNFTGRVCQIDVADGELELTARAWNILSFNRCPRFRVEGSMIWLAGKRWQYHEMKHWYGNWCWDAYWFREDVARQFLTWLHGRKLFNCEAGERAAFTRWGWREPFLAPLA